VGFKCFQIDDKIALDLGYSNIVTFKVPKSLKLKIFKNKIILFSFNKNYINNIGFLLKRSFKIDRYKGKGISNKNEIIKLKKKLN
jgi:ribosomal protein L6P/L9E